MNWERIERCVRNVYYDVAAGRVTNPMRIDDRMQECTQHTIEFAEYRQSLRTADPPLLDQQGGLIIEETIRDLLGMRP
jgi:hypothetical protein